MIMQVNLRTGKIFVIWGDVMDFLGYSILFQ